MAQKRIRRRADKADLERLREALPPGAMPPWAEVSHHIFGANPLWLPAAIGVAGRTMPFEIFYSIPELVDPDTHELLPTGPEYFERVADYQPPPNPLSSASPAPNPYAIREIENQILLHEENWPRLFMRGRLNVGFGMGAAQKELLMRQIAGQPHAVVDIDTSSQYITLAGEEYQNEDIPFRGIAANFMKRNFMKKHWDKIVEGNGNRPVVVTMLGIILGDYPLHHNPDPEMLSVIEFCEGLFSKLRPGKYVDNFGRPEFTGDVAYISFDNTMARLLTPAEAGVSESEVLRDGDSVTMPYAMCPPTGHAYSAQVVPPWADWFRAGTKLMYETVGLKGFDPRKAQCRTVVRRRGDWEDSVAVDLKIDDDHPNLYFNLRETNVLKALTASLRGKDALEAVSNRFDLAEVPIAGKIHEILTSTRWRELYFRKLLAERGITLLPNPDGSPGEPLRLPKYNTLSQNWNHNIYVLGKLAA